MRWRYSCGVTLLLLVLVSGACFAADRETLSAANGGARTDLQSYAVHGWTWSGWDAALLDPKTPHAQYNRGVMHSTGQGQPRDDGEALKWFRKAAGGGHVPSQCNLGIFYATGRGMHRDKVEAWAWFHIAAGQGDRKARANKEIIAASMTRDELDLALRVSLQRLESGPVVPPD